jgi:hypothetical protein
MTTMKALPMLDHVMLWITRCCAALTFIAVSAVILIQAVFYNAPSRDAIPWLVELLLIFFVWFVGTFYLFNKIVRTCLWLGSLYLFVVLFYNFCLELRDIPYFGDPLDYIYHLALELVPFPAIPLLGFASMIWVSLRPPQNSKNSDPDSPHHHPLPQSC